MSRRRAPRMSAETEAVVSTHLPQAVREVNKETRDAVMEAVRCWVAEVPPRDPRDAKRLMRAAVVLALPEYRKRGKLVTESVLHPDTVERRVRKNAKRNAAWRHDLRRQLTRLGRAANAQWWPIEPKRLGRPGTTKPYSADEEESFRLVGDLRCQPGQTAEVAVICLSLGAGLKGEEIKLVQPRDVVAVGDGRRSVHVRGEHPRQVPVREPYTDLTRRAVDAAGDSFFAADHSNMVTNAAERVPAPDGGHLRLRRARVTWLQAQLLAGVDWRALYAYAGGVSPNTLADLIKMSGAIFDAEAAVLEGLKA